jgi:hypothetical protein
MNGEPIDVDLEDLRDGNWACKPDGDQSYPNTHSERKSAYIEFAKLAGATPAGIALLTNPKNLVIAKDLNGLYDLEIPSATKKRTRSKLSSSFYKKFLSQPAGTAQSRTWLAT